MPEVLTARATLSSKGRLVIPKAIRDALGLHEGMNLRFTLGPEGSIHIKPLKHTREELFQFHPAKSQGRVNVDKAIQRTLREKHRRPG